MEDRRSRPPTNQRYSITSNSDADARGRTKRPARDRISKGLGDSTSVARSNRPYDDGILSHEVSTPDLLRARHQPAKRIPMSQREKTAKRHPLESV